MTSPIFTEPRYSSTRLFLVAMAFIVLSPLFWLLTEVRPAQPPDGYENADLYQRIYPTFHYAFDRMGKGDLPLWNPQQLCGVPLHVDARVGLWQPLNAIFLALPTERAMAVHAYVALALMGIGFALFLRTLGAGYLAALFGGIAFAFCGASAGIMSRPATAAAMAWAPWCFWAASEYLGQFKVGSAILTGVFTALMMLSGSYALALMFAVLLAAYLIYGCFIPFAFDAPAFPRRLAPLALAACIAAALSAVQWIPTLAWALTVDNAGRAVWNLHPAVIKPVQPRDILTQLFLTTAAALPRLGYTGIIVLPFILLGPLHREGRRPAFFFLATASGAWTFWILGPASLPLHFPLEAFAYAGIFGIATLAALGFDRLFTPQYRYNLVNVLLPVALALAVTTALFLIAPGPVRGYLLALLVVTVFFLIFRSKWAAMLSALVLILLLFTDLSVANANRFRHPFSNAPQCYQRYQATIDTAREQALGARALTSSNGLDPALPANLGMLTTIRCIGGRDFPLMPEQEAWWAALCDPAKVPVTTNGKAVTPAAAHAGLLNFMLARAVIATPDAPLVSGMWTGPGPPLREIRSDGEGRLFVNDQALPRVYWVPAVRIVSGVDKAIATMLSSDFDADRYCVIDRETPGVVRLGGEIASLETAPGITPSLSRADSACLIEEESPERITVKVDAPHMGMVVLGDTFAPGWTASVDGAMRVIFRANGMFRAVSVPQGKHEVTFVYRPWPFYAGAGVTLLCLLALFLGAFVTCVRRLWPKRNTPPQPAS